MRNYKGYMIKIFMGHIQEEFKLWVIGKRLISAVCDLFELGKDVLLLEYITVTNI